MIYSLISGKPFTDISKESSPDKSDAETTSFQSTSDIIADVPIVAIAVSATVFTALTPAAFNHLIIFSFIIYTPNIFFHVLSPTQPSGLSPTSFWNFTTAFFVSLPNKPSAVTPTAL